MRWRWLVLPAALLAACATRAPLLHTGLSRQLPVGPWSRTYACGGVTDAVSANALRRAGDGYVLGGAVQGTCDLGVGALTSRGGPDGYVARVGTDGQTHWVAQIGGAGAQTVVTGVVADPSGVYAAGWFNRTIAANGVSLASAGSTDGFLAKYDDDGALLWATRFGGATADRALGIGIDGGAVMVTGWFTGSASFGGPALVSAGQTDLFVAAYAPDGVPLWSLRAGGAGADEGRGIAGDWLAGRLGADGYVARIGASALLWSQTLPSATLNAVRDGVVVGSTVGGIPAPLVARYDAVGTLLWSHTYTAAAGAQFFGGDLRAVATADDAIEMTGAITDPIDFGGGPLVADYTADVVQVTLDREGVYQDAVRYPAPYSDYGTGIETTGAAMALAGTAQRSAFLRQLVADVPTATPTPSATVTGTPRQTETHTAAPTPIPSHTPTWTASASATTTATRTASWTRSPTVTPTNTPQPADTATPSATDTAVPTTTASETPTARPTATDSPRPTDSAVPTASRTATETNTMAPTATATSSMAASPTDTPPVVRRCDVTRDGSISTLDAVWILQAVAGLRTLDAAQQWCADASENGQVSTLDAVLVLRFVAGERGGSCGQLRQRGVT